MSMRRVTSLTIFFAFVTMVVTGIVLYIVPQGRVAYWADWKLLGLSKTQWGEIHVSMGLLMLLAGVLHIFYNWKPITTYLKDRSRTWKIFTPEFNTALIVAGLFVTLSLLELPPVSWITDLSDRVKDEAATTYGEPPYGHAEESSLARLVRIMGWDERESLARLTAAGFTFDDRKEVIKDVALANDTTPQGVFLALRPTPPAPGTGTLPHDPPPGLGRRSLQDLSTDFGVDLDDLKAVLAADHVNADGSDTLKELAEHRGGTPHDLYFLLRDALAAND